MIELLESSEYDVVMTVIDLVSKRAYFIPTHTTVTAEGIERLFLHYMWKLHDLPNHVVLDRGLQFIILFTSKLYYLLRVKIASSIARYSQLNGQTE